MAHSIRKMYIIWWLVSSDRASIIDIFASKYLETKISIIDAGPTVDHLLVNLLEDDRLSGQGDLYSSSAAKCPLPIHPARHDELRMLCTPDLGTSDLLLAGLLKLVALPIRR